MNNNEFIPSKKWVIQEPAKILREKATSIQLPLNDELKLLIQKMQLYIDACYDEKNFKYKIKAGIAIAAPQMNVSARIIYIHFDEMINKQLIKHQYLIANPKIIQESLYLCYLESGEGCLSIEKKYDGYVYRKNKIIVEAIDLFTNQIIKISAKGLLSICLQHEIDHLNGILYYDHINKLNPFELRQNAIKI